MSVDGYGIIPNMHDVGTYISHLASVFKEPLNFTLITTNRPQLI